MNKHDVWLDERIRRGLGFWQPQAPNLIDEEIVRHSNKMKDEPVMTLKGKFYVKKIALAASLILGALLLWLVGPRVKAPQSVLYKLPQVAHKPLMIIPGLFERVASPFELDNAMHDRSAANLVGKKKNADLSGGLKGAVPQQIDLFLEIPGKDITIAWCQREDFDLLVADGENVK